MCMRYICMYVVIDMEVVFMDVCCLQPRAGGMDDAEDDVQMEVDSNGPNSQAVHMNLPDRFHLGPADLDFCPCVCTTSSLC